MTQKTILSVEFAWPGVDVTKVDFDSQVSPLDGDIIVFDPDISSFLGYSESFRGKPSLSESSSFRLRERSDHWRRELLDAVNAGKTVVVFLNEIKEVFIHTGEREYSGTGRNRKTTHVVSEYNNYQCIPAEFRPVNSKGRAMKLSKESGVIASYWKDFGEQTEYRVRLEEKFGDPLVITKTGNKVVGAHFRVKSGGSFILLPYFDFYRRDYVALDEEEDELDEDEDELDEDEHGIVWKPEGIALGRRLLNHIIEIDKVVRQSSELTPAPSWSDDPAYLLPGEAKLRGELLQLENKIQELHQRKESLLSDLAGEGVFRRLLYEKSKPLELAIIEILKLMGFMAEPYQDAESEFDVVFESEEGRFLGEAEGKDKKAINIDKLRQLEMNIHEDYARDDVNNMAHGVLFGNAYRLDKPEERDGFFTTKCFTAAERSGVALVRTTDLFPIARYLTTRNDKRFATRCRKAILNTKGDVVEFPPVPDADKIELAERIKEEGT